MMKEAVDGDLLELFDSMMKRMAPTASDGKAHFDVELWRILEEAGVTSLSTEIGGGTLFEAAALVRTAAWNGACVPLGENDLLAGWLADKVGLPATEGYRAVVMLDEDGAARSPVAWASKAAQFLILGGTGAEPWIAVCDPDAVAVDPAWDFAGQSRDQVRLKDVHSLSRGAVDSATMKTFMLRAKLVRLIKSSGALDRANDLAITYAQERFQFGRAIAKFQAVQHHIADSVGEALLARAAVDRAVLVASLARDPSPDLELAVAIAASVTGHATSTVVRNTHQVFGAIGTTRENSLQRFTRAVLAWRFEFGSVREWDARVAELISQSSDGLWSRLMTLPD